MVTDVAAFRFVALGHEYDVVLGAGAAYRISARWGVSYSINAGLGIDIQCKPSSFFRTIAVWWFIRCVVRSIGALLDLSAHLSPSQLYTAKRCRGYDADLAAVMLVRCGHCFGLWANCQCCPCERFVVGLFEWRCICDNSSAKCGLTLQFL